MKTLAYIVVLCLTYSSIQAKYICSQKDLDTDYISIFETKEECQKYCGGLGLACKEVATTDDAHTAEID